MFVIHITANSKEKMQEKLLSRPQSNVCVCVVERGKVTRKNRGKKKNKKKKYMKKKRRLQLREKREKIECTRVSMYIART